MLPRRDLRQRRLNLTLCFSQELRRRGLYHCLWLLTATPMQLDPHEVHDLLLLCCLDRPSWGAWSSLTNFGASSSSSRMFGTDRSARTDVVAMTRLAVDQGAPDLDPSQVPPNWSPFDWNSLVRRIREGAAEADPRLAAAFRPAR